MDGDENEIPLIETKRLRLRGHEARDLPNCFDMWSDPEVTRYIGGQPSTEEEVWARLLRYRGHWELMGYGYWLVEDKHTAAFVGEVGFSDFRRVMTPPLKSVPEAGWAVASSARGRGFAVEALEAALTWLDMHSLADLSTCIINPQNGASIRLAAKCGYIQTHSAIYKDASLLVLERPIVTTRGTVGSN